MIYMQWSNELYNVSNLGIAVYSFLMFFFVVDAISDHMLEVYS